MVGSWNSPPFKERFNYSDTITAEDQLLDTLLALVWRPFKIVTAIHHIWWSLNSPTNRWISHWRYSRKPRYTCIPTLYPTEVPLLLFHFLIRSNVYVPPPSSLHIQSNPAINLHLISSNSLMLISWPWQSKSRWWFITSEGCTNPRWPCKGSWCAKGPPISAITI